jgi:hypothetical protein
MIASMKSILILAETDLARDPRVHRQIRFLQDDYAVTCAGGAAPNLPDVKYIALPEPCRALTDRCINTLLRLTGGYETVYWRQAWVRQALDVLSGVRPDLVLANDLNTLPVALKIANGVPVIYDAHEFAPLEFEDRLSFRLLWQGYRTHLCQRYLPQTAAMMTVCDGIAERFRTDFGVAPSVVWNAPDYEALTPSATGDVIRLFHHGAAIPSRHLEQMIEMMHHLDARFRLTLMLVPAPGQDDYLARLKQSARVEPRITFREPVPMRDIARTANEYDIGVFLLPPVNFNYRHALPNKFFEFIQARLAIAIGPSPEMAKLVNAHDLGIVANDFAPHTLAARLNALTAADVQRYKANADAVARQFSAEATKMKLLELVERV